MKNINWKNVLSNVAAFVVLMRMVYPNADGAAIVEAFQSGKIVIYSLDLFIAYFLFNHGKKEPKTIHYVTDDTTQQ